MAFKVAIFILLCHQFDISLGNYYTKPHILLNGTEDIIEAYDNYTVFCQGNKPLKWTLPNVSYEVKKTFDTKFTVVEEKPTSASFRYGLRLYITNMTYPYVGFYRCHYENARDISEKNEETDLIYLYVNDEDHLSVFADDILNVFAVQHHTVTIDCRPTSPTVEVKLSLAGEPSAVDIGVLNAADNTVYRYNPFYGFITNNTIEAGEPMFTCEYSRENKSQSHFIQLKVETPTSYIPAPIIVDENRGHTNVGDNLTLKCYLQFINAEVLFSWTTPKGPVDFSRMNSKSKETESLLTIYNTTLEDNGTYICHVRDHQNHHVSKNISIKIFDKEEHNITIREPTGTYYLQAKAGQESVIWSVQVWGHPEPTYIWLNNRNESIADEIGKKYEVSHSQPGVITLKIKNIDLIQDYGYYTLIGRNKYVEKSKTFFLNITDKPTVILRSDPFHMIGSPGKVECLAAAHPVPTFEWQYKKCLKPECPFKPLESTINPPEGLTISSHVIINATEIGIVKCTATNSVGSETEQMDYVVTDVPDGFYISGFDDTVVTKNNNQTAIYAVGEKIYMSCSTSSYEYSDIDWLVGNNSIKNDGRHKSIKTSSRFSDNLTLEMSDVQYNDSGIYRCQVTNKAGGKVSKHIEISVKDPLKTRIVKSNMKGEIFEDFPKKVSLHCYVEGIPKPKILWYKDDNVFIPKEPRIFFEDDFQKLVFNETKIKDQGKYKCSAFYKRTSDFREVKLKFRNAPATMQPWLYYIIAILFLALVALGIYLFIRVRTERRLKREMRLLGLANFEKGAVENINPELGIDDQAELLPYDKKWEFPIDQLKLGKQLGSGAFGVVLKGEAKNIVDTEPVTTVAVKMVKKNADNTYIKALASELKIMVHLGKHLNVVNLLGACTKNVAKRELLVIVEYCRFGNLQNYLLRQREHFINQIDPHTGKINYLIGQEELMDRTYSVSSNRSHTQSPMLKYAALMFSPENSENSVLPPPNAMGDYRTNNLVTGNTDVTTLTQGEDGVVLSNNSIQPEWRSNYKGDYKGKVNPISTKDLIAWAFQIARGMEYLASRKVLHGDLAARNVLLSEENVVKICDFGLAKSMYKNDNYKKRGDCPLPIKWMAIESIRDRVFSTQSDVWSFGIVLWELFSLGRTPYPGMEADERLYHKLVDGYRLESPQYAPNDMYDIMTKCWSVKPTTRPSFTKLTEKIGTLLEDTLRKHYIDLNDPYLAMNTKMLETTNDYLSMLSPPSYEAVLSPHYVNGMVTPQSVEEGYMSMNSSAIFSPRLSNEEVFDFASSGNRRLTSEYGSGHELLPMLQGKADGDAATPAASPNAVSNPSYHIPPAIEGGAVEETGAEIVKSADNYVNMPQNKNLLKDSKLALSDCKKSDVHYVNEIRNDGDAVQV
ncbi:unnamed protein product [Phyllotreta striolata]|uniref:receptor protein-tyrosine kinase n=1 Tax=Phyllotreta striolata TaxID=444603 RepID=A0A9P0DZI3_PHYSR|nr:unnamed protein product [Phyllotreta striolata]